MQHISVFLLFITLTYIQITFSLDILDNDQNENKFDEIRQIPSSLGKQPNPPECLSKNQLVKLLNRDRRASISRPYFYHWRQARDNSRNLGKNFLPFSPRLGKRAYENENHLDHFDNNFVSPSIDIVYEDSTTICFSQSIDDVLSQQVPEKADITRRDHDEQEKEEIRGRQTIGKHPVLFRYRLG